MPFDVRVEGGLTHLVVLDVPVVTVLIVVVVVIVTAAVGRGLSRTVGAVLKDGTQS